MGSHYPNIIQSIGLLIAVSLLIFALSVVGVIATAVLNAPLVDAPVFIAVVNLIAIGLALLWGFRRTRASFPEAFPLAPMSLSFPFPMALTVAGAAVVLSEADNILFAWSVVHTGSLLPCIFGHALFNAVPLIAMDILNLEIQGFTAGEFPHTGFQPLWFDLAGLLLAGLGVWLLVRVFGERTRSTSRA